MLVASFRTPVLVATLDGGAAADDGAAALEDDTAAADVEATC